MKNRTKIIIICIIAALIIGTVYDKSDDKKEIKTEVVTETSLENVSVVTSSTTEVENNIGGLSEVPEYNYLPYAIINNNLPFFKNEEMSKEVFETYSELDDLGRCGVAYANLCKEIMPTEERGEIGQIKPSGWQLKKYDNVDGKYLYNRCHLIGFQLAGENANEKNLITGTRYMNVEGMLPFENTVAEYINRTNNHVLYRVTPKYVENNLLASGVLIEAKSIEDNEISICVFCFNVQPDIEINYLNGESFLKENEVVVETKTQEEKNKITYILNASSKKFHKENCSSVETIKENNKEEFIGEKEELIEQGYSPCKICNP